MELVRSLLDLFSSIPNSGKVQETVLQENIDWAGENHRIFLRQSLQIRLAALQLSNQSYKPALKLVEILLVELRRLDDKLLLTEVHLLESKIYRGIGNFPKSKTALTSAKTAANSIYCPPHLQSQLDLQSGILHAEDKDYKTAYSYFFETFENQSSQGDEAALESFKYMLLCKIMLNLVRLVLTLTDVLARLIAFTSFSRRMLPL
jgi:26S proteasome regulatory subunit N6